MIPAGQPAQEHGRVMAMGEPGTKEVLSLDELEAAVGLRTGRKHILSILVENKPGVLTRIAGLFARRGFNIDTLAVGPTDDERLSRITLTLDGAVHPIDQVTKQLHKLVNVLKIRDLEPEETLARELALFKVSADGPARAEVMQICEIFRAKIVDVTQALGGRRGDRHVREGRGVRAAGPAVRADRDGAHRRDRDPAWPGRDLAASRTASRRRRRASWRELARSRTPPPARAPAEGRYAGHADGSPALASVDARRRPGRPDRDRGTPRGAPASRGSASSSPTATARRSPRSAACARSRRARRARFEAVARRWRAVTAGATRRRRAGRPARLGPRRARRIRVRARRGRVRRAGSGFAPASLIVPELSLARRRRARVADRQRRGGARRHGRGSAARARLAPAAASCEARRCRCSIRRRPAPTGCSARCRRRTTRRRWPGRCSGSAPASSRRSCSPARSRCTRRSTTIRPPCSACCARRSPPATCSRSGGARRDVRGGEPGAAGAPGGPAGEHGRAGGLDRAAAPTPRSTIISASSCCAATRIARRTRSSRAGSPGRCGPHAVWVTAAPEPALVRVANIQHLGDADPGAARGAARRDRAGRGAASDAGRRRRARAPWPSG